MATIISQIQQDQAKRQAQVNWRNDQLAIAILKAAASANCKADHVKKR